MGLIAFRQACSCRSYHASIICLRVIDLIQMSCSKSLPDIQRSLLKAAATHLQGNSALSQKMMRARVTAQVLRFVMSVAQGKPQ